MDASYSYHLSQALMDSFQELINTYNSSEEQADIKTETLKKIKTIVYDFLKETSSQDAIQEVKSLLTQVKVQSADKDLWNQIMGEIASIGLLNKLSALSPRQRFQLALQCGKAVTMLDLSHFQELNNYKLKKLQKACPNLRSLNLSWTPIEALDLSILNSFSRLEKLNISRTGIETLDKLPRNLKRLNLRRCHRLTAKELEKLHSFSQLEKLDVSSTEIITLDKLPKNLKELNLSDCQGLTAEEFEKLNSLLQLEKLKASYSYIATLDTPPKNLKEINLIELNLMRCKYPTEQELQKFDSFANLQLIYLPLQFKNKKLISLLSHLHKQVKFK